MILYMSRSIHFVWFCIYMDYNWSQNKKKCILDSHPLPIRNFLSNYIVRAFSLKLIKIKIRLPPPGQNFVRSLMRIKEHIPKHLNGRNIPRHKNQKTWPIHKKYTHNINDRYLRLYTKYQVAVISNSREKCYKNFMFDKK